MSIPVKNKYTWLVAITVIFLMSVIWNKKLMQFSSLRGNDQSCQTFKEEQTATSVPEGAQTSVKAQAKISVTAPPTELQLNIRNIFEKIERSLPKVTMTNWKTSTSGKNSKGFIANPKDKYCVGDVLTVQYDMYDHFGNRKTYGGDFLRPRIFTPEVNAGATGKVEDFNNGTYHIHFTLSWEGKVRVSTQLFHPSEGMAALWRSKHASLGVLSFQGRFKSATAEAITECGFKLETDKEVCEYIDQRDEEAYYCIKPPNLPCGSLNDMRAVDLHSSHLSAEERPLFERSNIGVEITRNFESIDVHECNYTKSKPTEKCRTGMESPFPSGYFLQNKWYPNFCNMVFYKTGDDYLTCLQGKRLFLIGDSTLRQYMMYFTEYIKIVKYFQYHEGGWSSWEKTLLAFNMDRDVMVSYKRHGFPCESFMFYLFKEDKYTSRQIDEQGGSNTIFVITLSQHFRQYPLQLYIKRALNIRKAIERLLTRSPDAKVIIKTDNTRDTTTLVERLGDFHGYCQHLVLKEVFKGVNVGFVDAFDITIAMATETVHPPLNVLENLMSMTFTYSC
ncbi:NXPE family member 4-like [Ambystoma mexicanum]|uniref:NXPE family member 4-like n=1 Tax=Ambystoma mexicanum TaxID=8296 RepID=UPI0037E9AD69